MSYATNSTDANQIFDREYCTCWRYGMNWMCVAGEDSVLPECPKRSDNEMSKEEKMEKRISELEAENKKLKKEIAEIEEARLLTGDIPDSWIDDE